MPRRRFRKVRPKTTEVTLSLEFTIEHRNKKEYETRRDDMIDELFEQGFTVNLTDERELGDRQ